MTVEFQVAAILAGIVLLFFALRTYFSALEQKRNTLRR